MYIGELARLGRQRQLNATPLLVLPANFLFLVMMTMKKMMVMRTMMRTTTTTMMIMMMMMTQVMQRRGQEGLGRITVLGTL